MAAEYSRTLALALNTKKALQLTVAERKELVSNLTQYRGLSDLPPELKATLDELLSDDFID